MANFFEKLGVFGEINLIKHFMLGIGLCREVLHIFAYTVNIVYV